MQPKSGEVKLFDATESKNSGEISNLVTNMLAEDYTGDDLTVASTKAIVDYVAAKVGNVSTVLTSSFFKSVTSHTITADDLTNDSISLPDGVEEGEVGLLFTADTDNEEGGESYVFISLKNYLQNVYTFEASKSIEFTVGDDNKVTANLKFKDGEQSLLVDEENGGVYINKATIVNDGDGTDEGGEAPSADKLVTEEALVNYVVNAVLPAVNQAIQEALQDVVTASIEDGTSES